MLSLPYSTCPERSRMARHEQSRMESTEVGDESVNG